MELVPTCNLFRFRFPSNIFCTQFKKGAHPALPVAGTTYCVVLQHEYHLTVYELRPEQYAFTLLIATRMTVAAAKAAFGQRRDMDTDDFVQQWVAANIFQVQPKLS